MLLILFALSAPKLTARGVAIESCITILNVFSRIYQNTIVRDAVKRHLDTFSAFVNSASAESEERDFSKRKCQQVQRWH